MNTMITNYYKQAGVQQFLIDEKISKLEKHSDIAAEFEYWINNHKFLDSVNVEGYVASDIINVSPFFNGEGAFMMLIELRESPNKAKKKLNGQLKLK